MVRRGRLDGDEAGGENALAALVQEAIVTVQVSRHLRAGTEYHTTAAAQVVFQTAHLGRVGPVHVAQENAVVARQPVLIDAGEVVISGVERRVLARFGDTPA